MMDNSKNCYKVTAATSEPHHYCVKIVAAML